MDNKSIFEFLNSDKIFKDIYNLCLNMEQVINIGSYNASLNISRTIIEGLFNHIIVNIECDNQLSKKFYKKKNNSYIGLKSIIIKCKRKKYITAKFENRLLKFLNKCGNPSSHFTKDNFKMEDVKKAHHLVFDFSLFAFKKINPCFEKEYKFDLSYLKSEVSVEKSITLDDFEKILKSLNVNEFSIEDIFDEMENRGLHLLSDDEISVFKSQLNENIVDNERLIQLDNKFKEFEDDQITLSQIDELIQKNNNDFKDELFNSMKSSAENVMKDYLKDIVEDLRNKVNLIDNNHKIIDVPNYEVIKIDDDFEIREIEEIIGVPENCPKCNSKLSKGSTSCDNCGYSFFEELNKKCPNCGKRVPMGAKECVHCGTDLQRYICSKCGYKNKEDSKFCVKCGNKL